MRFQPRFSKKSREFSFVLRWVCLPGLALCLTLFPGCKDRGPKLDAGQEHLVAAKAALAKGDQATAMKELDASIAASPSEWAYLERAKLKHEMQQDPDAIADCEAGLKLDAENKELTWLMGELKKPKAQQFQGKAAAPPSASK